MLVDFQNAIQSKWLKEMNLNSFEKLFLDLLKERS